MISCLLNLSQRHSSISRPSTRVPRLQELFAAFIQLAYIYYVVIQNGESPTEEEQLLDLIEIFSVEGDEIDEGPFILGPFVVPANQSLNTEAEAERRLPFVGARLSNIHTT